MEPRGIRNNNPLNIRLSSDKWQGQRPPSNSPEGEGSNPNPSEGSQNGGNDNGGNTGGGGGQN